MGNHSKEDNDKMNEHVAEAMRHFTSNMAKDNLCYACGLERIALMAMMNHFMQAILQKPVPSVTPLEIAAYVDFIGERLFEFIMSMDGDKDSIKFYRFDEQGDVIPEKKNMI